MVGETKQWQGDDESSYNTGLSPELHKSIMRHKARIEKDMNGIYDKLAAR